MANNVIVYAQAGSLTAVQPGVSTSGDAGGFDTVSCRYLQLISASAAAGAYPPGGQTACPVQVASGGKMLLMGVSDGEELPGGYYMFTLTWRGLLNGNKGGQSSANYSVRETTYDSLAGVPGAGGSSVRARVLDVAPGYSIRLITTTEPQRPKPQGGSYPSPAGAPQINNQDQVTVFNAAKTWVYPNGWIPYSWSYEEPIPGIYFLTADYKYEFDIQFG